MAERVRDEPAADTATGFADAPAYLAAVIDTSNDAIVSKSLDGTIRSWNQSAMRIFGYRAEEIVGLNVRLLIPDELQAEEDEILERLRAGEYIEHYETVRLTKDGRRVDVSLSISPIKDREGRVIGAAKIARDITSRKEADELIASATAKFESVFNQSAIFAGILDLDGNLREVNALAVEWGGATKDELVDHPFWAAPWWRGSDDVQAGLRDAIRRAADGDVFRETLPYWLADGSERLVDFALHPIRDDSGAVRFLYSTGLDVTDRVLFEQALQAREAEEREIALGLQRALLPGKLVVPDGVSVAARYEAGSAALEVGGDWYDVFRLDNGCVALTVGDVVGHGLAAAAAMGQMRTALAALAQYTEQPGELLTRLDKFVANTDATDFATVSYGVLDPSTGTFEYASAGHPPILLVPPGAEPEWLDNAQSPPLWGGGQQHRRQARVVLAPGSLLVLFTDGLVERRGELISDSLARMRAAASALAGLPPSEVCDTLIATFEVEAARGDDVAVLAVRYDPAVGAGFYVTVPAQPEELRRLRQVLRSWLEERNSTEEMTNALLLAVGEACSNSIEHAYDHDSPGDITIHINEAHDRSLQVSVRDFGRFRPISTTSTDRGRGTTIMQRLTTEFSRTSTTDGTTVSFRLPKPDTAAA
jgi:PAS domain S-box-containing protein